MGENYMKKEEKRFPSSDGSSSIHVNLWLPDENTTIIGIVQIAHGMIDHIERYENMAKYLTTKGLIVAGNDHIGHGKSVKTEDELGYFTKADAGKYIVEDMYRLTKTMKNKYPELPYFLLGHSMGSFMTRRYLSVHGDELSGVIILGTGNQPMAMIRAGFIASSLLGAFRGKHYRSSLLNALMFGSYNKRIADSKTEHDWLTCNAEIVDKYNADPLCSYKFTTSGYIGVMKTLLYIRKAKNIQKIPNKLPMLMASGQEDPVGGYGKDVTKLYHSYSKYLSNITFKLYPNCRHELHNETNNAEVFEDLYTWIMNTIENGDWH
jgi:alpha-beta hydrolase superfamily lysophospholipase